MFHSVLFIAIASTFILSAFTYMKLNRTLSETDFSNPTKKQTFTDSKAFLSIVMVLSGITVLMYAYVLLAPEEGSRGKMGKMGTSSYGTEMDDNLFFDSDSE